MFACLKNNTRGRLRQRRLFKISSRTAFGVNSRRDIPYTWCFNLSHNSTPFPHFSPQCNTQNNIIFYIFKAYRPRFLVYVLLIIKVNVHKCYHNPCFYVFYRFRQPTLQANFKKLHLSYYPTNCKYQSISNWHNMAYNAYTAVYCSKW